MDKTITRTKALQDLSDKCNMMRCSDCHLHYYCGTKSFKNEFNEELEQIYNLFFDEKSKKLWILLNQQMVILSIQNLNLQAKILKKCQNDLKQMKRKKQADKTNPNYYKNECSLECIETMLIAFGSDKVYDFCICNAFKYMWSYKNKNGFEDVKKARWYVNKGERINTGIFRMAEY